MADIKVREVNRGSIKTLDRAANSMHHIKEATVRTKFADIYGNQDNDENAYAQNRIEHYVGDSATYAARAGVELLQRSRSQTDENAELLQCSSSQISNNDEYIHRFGADIPVFSEGVGQNDERIHRAARTEGIKRIRGKQQLAKMTDDEVLQNAGEYREGSFTRNSALRRNVENIQRFGRRNSNIRPKIPKSDENIQRKRRLYAIDRIISRQNARAHNFISQFRSNEKEGRGAARTLSSFIKFMWERSRTAILTIGTGGTAAVIIVTLFVFFGIGAITFSNNSPETSITENQEKIVYFIPDLEGSPTRYAVVQAAAREIGNVGGRKFWSWYGFSSRVHWCACFTSYIAAECGCIQSGICPKDAGVEGWMNFYKKQHRWAPGNYIPHSGDFILFDFNGNGTPDHIGIVESCDGKTVHTIEGNSGNRCRRGAYTRGATSILGYGCPNYSGT